ncbi:MULTISPECIES: NUDIX domain-containing protein [unclassified Sphingomonas]|uniref:NUDIX domain-containing protein n=1 Tax=Novosphingobium rhizosphaerae TaxID=1551649 RepID=UPI0015CA7E50
MIALPKPLHRAALRVAHRLRVAWWRWRQVPVLGCMVVARNAAGHVLLVRHSYHHSTLWMLPGGGLARGESPVATAARELAEETGCTLVQAVHFADHLRDRGGWLNQIALVAGLAHGTPRADGRELEEAAFFALDALPPTTSPATREMIALWQHKTAQASER